VAWAFGGHHPHVQVLAGLDLAEVDVEAVGEGQGPALLEVGLNVLAVNRGLELVGQENHDDVRLGHGLRGGEDPKPGPFRLGPALGTGAEAHPHVHPRVLEVQGVGVPLGAKAQNGHLLAGKKA